MRRAYFLAILVALSFTILTNCRDTSKDNEPATRDTLSENRGNGTNEGMGTTTTGQDNTVDKWWTTAGETRTMTGRIVSLNRVVSGSPATMTRQEAEKMTGEGQVLVFQEGTGKNGNVYFVYNNDGSYAGSKLMDFVDRKSVSITGRTLSQNDVKMIIVDKIDAGNM